jgi:hypothetical protein
MAGAYDLEPKAMREPTLAEQVEKQGAMLRELQNQLNSLEQAHHRHARRVFGDEPVAREPI